MAQDLINIIISPIETSKKRLYITITLIDFSRSDIKTYSTELTRKIKKHAIRGYTYSNFIIEIQRQSLINYPNQTVFVGYL